MPCRFARDSLARWGTDWPAKPMETRNLLTENVMYHMFESTFLRQQVTIIREVIRDVPDFGYLVALLRDFQPSTCSREIHFWFTRA